MEKYLKRKASTSGKSSPVNSSNNTPPPTSTATIPIEVETEVDLNNLPWDPSERKRISEYPPNLRDKIRREYLIKGPCQPRIHTFPWKVIGNKKRRFNPAWFNQFGNWLEYSVKADKAYCLCCYLFKDHVPKQGGCDAFVTEGFNGWNKTERLGLHVGDVNSLHNKAVKKLEDFMKQDPSIAIAIQEKLKKEYQLRLDALGSTTIHNHTALLVIDMQNDFVLEDGSLRVDGGLAIVPNVIKAVQVARQRGILVVWVVREHDPMGRDVELFRRHLYADGKPKPTSKGSKGAELVDGLFIKEEDYKIVKTRFSAFFATNLHSVLQGAGIDSLVVVGVQTPNCVRQTVFDAVEHDYKNVTVIVDATAAATPDVHAANIYDMKNIGVAAPTLEEWCESNSTNTCRVLSLI